MEFLLFSGCRDTLVNHSKRQKIVPEIPQWELDSGFNPLTILDTFNPSDCFVNFRGVVTQPSACVRAESVVYDNAEYDLENLAFRNPDCFQAGNVHRFYDEWVNCKASDEVLKWIKEGVDGRNFFKHFKGNFKGKFCDSDLPPSMYFPNALNCKEFSDFIVKTLEDRLKMDL